MGPSSDMLNYYGHHDVAPEVSVVTRSSRNSVWFYALLALTFVGGFCLIGFWQSFDVNCSGAARAWVWIHIPPHFECRLPF
jgi:hypothetical protein